MNTKIKTQDSILEKFVYSITSTKIAVIYCTVFTIFATVLWLAEQYNTNDMWLLGIYKNLRTAFFTRFLTAGSFLLSMNTFTLDRMKRFYDSDEYREFFRKAQIQNLIPEGMTRLSQLKNLNRLISNGMLVAFLSSLLQVTLGLWEHEVAVVICIPAAIATIILILIIWTLIRHTSNQWLNVEDIQSSKSPANTPA